MKKICKILTIAILLFYPLGYFFASSSATSVPSEGVTAIPACTSSLPDSYQMQKGESIYSVSHGINGEFISMYVPVPAPTESLPGQPSSGETSIYFPVASNAVPSKPASALATINQRLASGDSVTIYYDILSGLGGNFYLHVSAKTGSESKAFYKAQPMLLTSTIPLKNGISQTDPFPATEQVVNKFDVEPATPYSIPFNLMISSANNLVLSGNLCFSGVFDSVKGWKYSSSFTFLPYIGDSKTGKTPSSANSKSKPKSKKHHVSKDKKKVSQIKALTIALLRNDNAVTTANAKKIASVFSSNSYTAQDWGSFICKGLQQANVPSRLGQLIAQELGLPMTAYPCTMLK